MKLNGGRVQWKALQLGGISIPYFIRVKASSRGDREIERRDQKSGNGKTGDRRKVPIEIRSFDAGNGKDQNTDQDLDFDYQSNFFFRRFSYHSLVEMVKTILFIEDDERLAKIFLDTLVDYEVLVCPEAESAIQLLEERNKNEEVIDLIILDLGLPGMSGRQFLAWKHAHYPLIPVLIYSGKQPEVFTFDDVKGVLQKPVMLGQMLHAIEKIVGDA